MNGNLSILQQGTQDVVFSCCKIPRYSAFADLFRRDLRRSKAPRSKQVDIKSQEEAFPLRGRRKLPLKPSPQGEGDGGFP